jgi:hypothetical protein
MDVGREFTERWHHQMHIRDAVGAPGLTTRRWLEPVLRLAVFALRRSFATIEAAPGASVVFEVRGTWRHRWTMLREPSGWTLAEGAAERPDASVTMDAETAWRMFFNFCSTEHARQHAVVQGDIGLAEAILPTRSLMIREAISEP